VADTRRVQSERGGEIVEPGVRAAETVSIRWEEELGPEPVLDQGSDNITLQPTQVLLETCKESSLLTRDPARTGDARDENRHITSEHDTTVTTNPFKHLQRDRGGGFGGLHRRAHCLLTLRASTGQNHTHRSGIVTKHGHTNQVDLRGKTRNLTSKIFDFCAGAGVVEKDAVGTFGEHTHPRIIGTAAVCQ